MTAHPGTPPVADRRPIERHHHGDTVIDDYEWLRNPDDPDVLAYLTAENEYAEAHTAHLAPLRDTIFGEIKSRVRETDMSLPVRHADWWYYRRTVEGGQYAIHCRVPATDWTPPQTNGSLPHEQVLLDGNAEAENLEFFALGAFSLSDDGNVLAWSVDERGDERYRLRFKDLRTGEILTDEITGIAPGATWSADGRHVFYTRVDESWRPFQVWRHVLGTDPAEDILVHTETDARFFVGVGRSNSEKYLVLHIGSKITSETRLLAADDPTGEFATIWPRVEGVEYSVEHFVLDGLDHVAILHNRTGANFALEVAPVTDFEDITTVIPVSDTTRLDDVEAFAHHLAISFRREALPRVGLIDLSGVSTPTGLGDVAEVDFGETLFSAGLGGNAEWDPPVIRVAVTSFIRPARVYDLDLATRELVLRKEAEVLGGHDPGDYVQERVWATADDGTDVPVSVVRRADTPTDGSAAGLIYGYGSYEASIDPGFSIPRLSLLDRGFVFAVAHVRGGGELGRAWYDDGKLLNKTNTFTDFVAAARHLIEGGWVAPDRLVAEGGSAGGLLMGAVANLAPELFCGIVAEVPFVDPLTTILDPDLPLTVIEWDEWGNPLEDPDVYAYMKSYSPYENIRRAEYPAMLVVTSLHDTRVHYVEPAKWVARLRAESGSTQPIVLKTEMAAGHGGVSGRYSAWRERAWELSWIIDVATHT